MHQILTAPEFYLMNFSPLVKCGFRQKVQLKELEYQTEFLDWIVSTLPLSSLSLAGFLEPGTLADFHL